MCPSVNVRSRYDGPVTVSGNWTALDAKKDKFRETEEKMLILLKRDYGLTDIEGLNLKMINYCIVSMVVSGILGLNLP